MKSVWLFAVSLVVSAHLASAASLFLATGIRIEPSKVYALHMTEADYEIAYYYDIQTDGFILRNGQVVKSDLAWSKWVHFR